MPGIYQQRGPPRWSTLHQDGDARPPRALCRTDTGQFAAGHLLGNYMKPLVRLGDTDTFPLLTYANLNRLIKMLPPNPAVAQSSRGLRQHKTCHFWSPLTPASSCCRRRADSPGSSRTVLPAREERAPHGPSFYPERLTARQRGHGTRGGSMRGRRPAAGGAALRASERGSAREARAPGKPRARPSSAPRFPAARHSVWRAAARSLLPLSGPRSVPRPARLRHFRLTLALSLSPSPRTRMVTGGGGRACHWAAPGLLSWGRRRPATWRRRRPPAPRRRRRPLGPDRGRRRPGRAPASGCCCGTAACAATPTGCAACATTRRSTPSWPWPRAAPSKSSTAPRGPRCRPRPSTVSAAPRRGEAAAAVPCAVAEGGAAFGRGSAGPGAAPRGVPGSSTPLRVCEPEPFLLSPADAFAWAAAG